MSTTTETTEMTEPATAVAIRDKVGWRDLTWVTLRQHRGVLLTIVALGVLAAAVMLGLAGYIGSGDPLNADIPYFSSAYAFALLTAAAMTVYGALIAVFWGAPLLAREYELRTHMFAWSQDVSAQRWLWSKVAVLSALAALAAALVGTAAAVLLPRLDHTSGIMDEPTFGMSPVVQIGYALFGFALGLAASALTRRTVASIGVTVAGFIIVRCVVAITLRPYYVTPLRETSPLGSSADTVPQEYGMYVDNGLLDRAGQPMDYPRYCNTEQYEQCLRNRGAVSYFTDYQPAGRLGSFQWIEAGIFVGLAALLFLVTWRVFRKVSRL